MAGIDRKTLIAAWAVLLLSLFVTGALLVRFSSNRSTPGWPRMTAGGQVQLALYGPSTGRGLFLVYLSGSCGACQAAGLAKLKGLSFENLL
jgi:hypothetical protein